ncbi:unnamed protein product [Nippostrongylus brasiliensis]|uniref:Papilin (inferred by orthology to a C. elegans protein) n=1 Tax=Nippostrongylus brasiliensis TaxID=27835 RepID=A0A158R3B6_NIPBR|nr:unnamed protein product [Nippostrongylus brasiliensis]
MRALLLSVALFQALNAFSLFSSNEPTTPYLHPLSRPEISPAEARVKRQAYQVYVDGDSSVSLDKTGQSETGPWGPWTPEQCSRTCGGGVQTEKRQCSCELLCRPENAKFYYKWDDKVVDGTKCDSKGDDICVDGVCLPLGCDGKLGSDLKLDKCGVCDGDGSKCKTIAGRFDERNLSPGYHDVMRLPVGSTAIRIEEARPSSNNLAMKNTSDVFFLNGNSMIQVEKEVDINGVLFEYDDGKPERISAKGPLKEVRVERAFILLEAKYGRNLVKFPA